MDISSQTNRPIVNQYKRQDAIEGIERKKQLEKNEIKQINNEDIKLLYQSEENNMKLFKLIQQNNSFINSNSLIPNQIKSNCDQLLQNSIKFRNEFCQMDTALKDIQKIESKVQQNDKHLNYLIVIKKIIVVLKTQLPFFFTVLQNKVYFNFKYLIFLGVFYFQQIQHIFIFKQTQTIIYQFLRLQNQISGIIISSNNLSYTFDLDYHGILEQNLEQLNQLNSLKKQWDIRVDEFRLNILNLPKFDEQIFKSKYYPPNISSKLEKLKEKRIYIKQKKQKEFEEITKNYNEYLNSLSSLKHQINLIKQKINQLNEIQNKQSEQFTYVLEESKIQQKLFIEQKQKQQQIINEKIEQVRRMQDSLIKDSQNDRQILYRLHKSQIDHIYNQQYLQQKQEGRDKNNNQIISQPEEQIQNIQNENNKKVKIIDNYYENQKLNICNHLEVHYQELEYLNEQILSFEQFCNTSAYSIERHQQISENSDSQIQSLNLEIIQLEDKAKMLKLDFQMKNNIVICDDFSEKNVEQKVLEITQLYDNKLKLLKDEISQMKKKEKERQNNEDEQFIVLLPQQNDKIFQKLYCAYEMIHRIITNSMIIKNHYINLIEQMISMRQLFIHIKSFKNINDITINDTEERVINYYQQFDKHIKISDINNAKKRIILIQNCSLIKLCKEQKKEIIYHETINNILFKDIFKLIQNKNKEKNIIDNFIYSEFIPNIIMTNKQLQNTNQRIKKLDQQIQFIQRQLALLKEDDLNQQEDDMKSRQKLNIQKLESKLEKLIEKMNMLEELQIMQDGDFKEKSFNDSQIIKTIIVTFIEAIENSQLQIKHLHKTQPYLDYANTSKLINDQLINFANPQLFN